MITNAKGEEIVVRGTPRELELNVLRCRELLATAKRSPSEDAELVALLPAILDAAEAMAVDVDVVKKWASEANKATGFPDNERNELNAREAIAGIGNARWYHFVRDLFRRNVGRQGR